jgi:hypothetical protein
MFFKSLENTFDIESSYAKSSSTPHMNLIGTHLQLTSINLIEKRSILAVANLHAYSKDFKRVGKDKVSCPE